MMNILKRAEAPQAVVDLLKELKCHVCESWRKPKVRRLVTAEAADQPHETLQIDHLEWANDHNNEKSLITIMIDECSKFARCYVHRTVEVCENIVKKQANTGIPKKHQKMEPGRTQIAERRNSKSRKLQAGPHQ